MFFLNEKSHRHGGSIFQVIATLSAVVVGMGLGGWYLGVDYNELAYTTLNDAELLEKLPENWRPKPPQCDPGECPGPTAEEQAAKLRSELNHLRVEASALREASTGDTAMVETVSTALGYRQTVEREEIRERTIAYWQRLYTVALEVAELHNNVAADGSSLATGHMLNLRQRAFDYGQRAADAIPHHGVDPTAVDAAARLSEWYGNGAELYKRAINVWDGQTVDKPASLSSDALANAQQQHENEAKLLRDKASRVSEVLTRRYSVEFPVLGL